MESGYQRIREREHDPENESIINPYIGWGDETAMVVKNETGMK